MRLHAHLFFILVQVVRGDLTIHNVSQNRDKVILNIITFCLFKVFSTELTYLILSQSTYQWDTVCHFFQITYGIQH